MSPTRPGNNRDATSLWQRIATPASINELHAGTAVSHLGIEFIEVGLAHMRARMPVDERTRQPAGLLHGGAMVLLAETLASCAAVSTLPEGRHAVGIEINANHVRSVRDGVVSGTCTSLHLGSSTQVWQVEIRDARDRLCCISRVTVAVLK
jgi:uncharacterized protein (TIGR00369 family)